MCLRIRRLNPAEVCNFPLPVDQVGVAPPFAQSLPLTDYFATDRLPLRVEGDFAGVVDENDIAGEIDNALHGRDVESFKAIVIEFEASD